MTEFNKETYEQAKQLARKLMPQIVDGSTGLVRFASLTPLHGALRRLGFRLIQKQQYGPAGGRQLFYGSGLLVVRLKTKGDARGFRANQPHLSAAVTDGQGLDWQNERGKLTAQGVVAAKALTTAENFNPVDFQGNPQKFVMIMGGKYSGAGQQAWADRTHFPCPPGFTDAGVEQL